VLQPTVAARLGHPDVETTLNRYGHATDTGRPLSELLA
jgi:hypothetical protein